MNVASPLAPTARAPGTGLYWLGGGLIVAGVVAFLFFLTAGVADLAGVWVDVDPIAPGRSSVTLLDPGSYLVYAEGGSGEPAVEGPGGLVTLTPVDSSQTVEINGFTGSAIAKFEVARPGFFTIANHGNTRIAVDGLAWWPAVEGILVGVGIGGGLVKAGVILLIFTGYRRRKSKRQLVPAGTPGQHPGRYPASNTARQYRYPRQQPSNRYPNLPPPNQYPNLPPPNQR